MRDAYGASDPEFTRWLGGHRYGPDDRPEWFQGWGDTVEDALHRGVAVRRARIVSEPVTDYIKYEHHVTYLNLLCGEQVRWLPRRKATGIALPGNDFWLFDGELALVHYFAGDGELVDREVTSVPEVTQLFASAFEAVWDLGIPHQEYKPE
jgi:hypothetical protein